MTNQGTSAQEVRRTLSALQRFPGDPSVQAKAVELHTILEEELLKLRAEVPDPNVVVTFPEPGKQELFNQLRDAREALSKKNRR